MSLQDSTAVKASAFTVDIVGLGPAGRIAAHRCAARGWRVRTFDPSPHMPSTIGVWTHQIPRWAPRDLIAASFQPSVVLCDGTTRHFRSSYSVLDTSALQQLGTGDDICHFFEAVDTMAHCQRRSGFLTTSVPQANAVIDTTPGGSVAQIRQLAFGQIFHRKSLPNAARTPILMDFTRPGGRGASCNVDVASFSYRIPLSDDRFLIEETFLAINERAFDFTEAQLIEVLRQRQSRRLASLGVDARAALNHEIVSFPLLAPAPFRYRKSRRGAHLSAAYAFGFGGGWLHPATGYSVGQVLAGVDSFLDGIFVAAGSDRAGSTFREVATLPPAGRTGYALRQRGLNALLSFDETELGEFFHAFFQLPEEKVQSYLTGTTTREILSAMIAVAGPLLKTDPVLAFRLVKGFYGDGSRN